MPSNKDLITAIGEEAAAKGVETPGTEEKNNAELADILKELKAKEPVAPTPPADAEASRKAAQEQVKKEAEAIKVPPPPKPAPYTVATGKAITCKKGVLGEGEEIKEEYLAGGNKDLDNLVTKGFVVKN